MQPKINNMKKTVLLFNMLVFTTIAAFSQSGNNQFIPALELGIPTGSFNDFKTGFGVSGKALIGVGQHAQIGFSTGYTWFKLKGSTDAYKVKNSVVPILVGYRYHLPVIYIEPQLGYGIYTSTVKTQTGSTETKVSNTNGGFTWTFGGGIQVGNVDIGVRYQAGYPGGGTIGFFGFHLGYVFSSQRRS
jgi:hypothetical protein